MWVVEIELVSYAGRKSSGFSVSIELAFILVLLVEIDLNTEIGSKSTWLQWMVGIGLISVWVIGLHQVVVLVAKIDLISVREIELDLISVLGSELVWFLCGGSKLLKLV